MPKVKAKKKAKRRPAKKVRTRQGCRLTICVDPKTGAAKMVRDGHCPPGFVKKVNNAIRRGVILLREDDDDDE